MTVFVLVHGAWGGAHGFRKVRGPLREAGHEVFTPSLTGIGERAHLTSPQVSLTTHIADVVNAVLVRGPQRHRAARLLLRRGRGHRGARAHRRPGRGTWSTSTPSCPATVTQWPAWAARGRPRRASRPWAATGWCHRSPASTTTRPRRRGPAPRRTPHPAGCFTEPVRLARPLEDYPFTRTYIKATGEPRPDDGGPFWAAADRAVASPAWRYREIATNHMIASNRPGELVRAAARADLSGLHTIYTGPASGLRGHGVI